MRRVPVPLFALVLSTACGATQYDSKTTSQELPASPKGTLSGQVLTSRLGPISGADVTLVLAAQGISKEALTDDTGAFGFLGLPAGSQILITISKPGFATLRTEAIIPVAAGEFPLENANVNVGPFTLTQTNATQRFTVLSPRGAPAAGAKATLEVSPAGSDLTNGTVTGVPLSAVVVEGTVDEKGALAFLNVPAPAEIARYAGNYRLWVAPLDANNDGIPESGGFAAVYKASDLVTDASPRFVQLTPLAPGGALRVDGGNVGSLKSSAELTAAKNLVKPGEPVLLVFNQPVVEDSVLVRLTNEDASSRLAFQTSLAAGGQLLTITPQEPVTPGAEYNVRVQAVSAAGTVYQQTGWFIGGDPAAPVSFALKNIRYQESSTALPSRLTTDETVYVNLNQVVRRLGDDDQHVQVFFSTDIDGDNKTGGETVGELGNVHGKGIDLVADEPLAPLVTSLLNPETPLFPIQRSGYTTRWSFKYPGSVTLDPGAVEITVAFSALAKRTPTTYLTAWGEPIETDVKASPSIIPPPDEGN